MVRPLPGQVALFEIPVDEAAAHDRHVERVTAHHAAHALSGRAHVDCRTCRADPPVPRVIPHAFGELATKWRTAAHLEFAHADRALHSNLTLRTGAELAAHHRSLHDARK